MNEATYTAILLKATDYRDSDRRVRLLTLEAGAINAVMRGVKKKDAKLKFGAQPFAFCQYVLAEGKGGYVVTGCSALGDFFPIATNPDKYVAGCLMLEAADVAAYGQPSADQFILLLSCLKQLAYGSALPNTVAAHFLCKLTDSLGYTGNYGNASTLAPVNLLQANAALQSVKTDAIESLSFTPVLAQKTAKMQAGRFANKTDTLLKSAKML